MKTQTLRFKLIRGFLLMLIPLALFLYYDNYYAMRVVREEVSHSISDALSFYVSETDRGLEEASNYLLRQATTDLSYSYLIDLSLHSSEESEYFQSKWWILRTFMNDLSAYKTVDTFFAYSVRNDDLITTDREYEITERNDRLLKSYCKEKGPDVSPYWQVYRFENKSYLIRLVLVPGDVYVGAVVETERLMVPIANLDDGGGSRLLLLTEDGIPLAGPTLPGESLDVIRGKQQGGQVESLTFKDPADGKKYMLVAADFQWAPIRLVHLIPEQEKLQQLPFFQRVVLFIPFGAVVLLYFYNLFLKRILLAPMNALIKGMRKIMNGDFEVRLQEYPSTEFKFLIETFNTMVSQVRNLKINIYEEKLKAQSSEFKHLQAQINPHFYLNSLNIIYSLSMLGENRLVEKMAEHLADYFRFITRSHRDLITFGEELEHIRNYMEIQSLRFPDKLTYALDIPEHCKPVLIPPLTVQPFVENAIIHGMDRGSAVFHVSIDAKWAEGDSLAISIIDNGRGFSPEQLNRFRQGEFGTGTGSKNLGIWNVMHRLHMKYGGRAVVSFENGEERGAVIRIVLPADTGDQGGGADV
ncbi:sensor histidine kinase [Paenibacillus ferrarius]|uniref:sensor histidine kinase n=1 Tax=Paenibacillus ferrarius TaxID=1469647 RepID=UPI003D27E6EA